MMEKLTDRASKAIQYAKLAAGSTAHVDALHIILGLSIDNHSSSGRALGECSITTYDIRQAILSIGPWRLKSEGILPDLLTKLNAKRQDFIGTEHILLEVLCYPDVLLLLHELNVYPSQISNKLLPKADESTLPTNEPSPFPFVLYV